VFFRISLYVLLRLVLSPLSRNTKLSLEKKEREGEGGGKQRREKEKRRRESWADYAFHSTSHDQKIVVLDFSSGLGVDPGLIV
jgi:hypothetical protein